MSKKTKAEVTEALKELREIIDDEQSGVILRRVAYAMESAVRWAVEDTEDWPSLAEEAIKETEILAMEIRRREANG